MRFVVSFIAVCVSIAAPAPLRAQVDQPAQAGGSAQPNAAQKPPTNAAPSRLTKAPELVEFVQAPYPEVELEAARSAEVVLSIAVSAEGTVSEAKVIGSASEA